ncbi:hypothetical protein [Nocardiopsis halotolerans]|uniref:hypothetical protein n=1 Tax=Nocardiopsis halotolerans TaxID=124252 RepID=UPI00034801E4|nr:hypothetical protein [Nocardiopsis halotolerans]
MAQKRAERLATRPFPKGSPPPAGLGRAIATLGPKGTDAENEARRWSEDVVLKDSFPEAIEHALKHSSYALVAAGYLDIVDGAVVDNWADVHFRYHGRLNLACVWESPTKPMCLAVNPAKAQVRDHIGSAALHPATLAFAKRLLPPTARLTFVTAKPLGAYKASSGEVDACIGSVDVVEELGNLTVLETMHPSMVWCLYGPDPRNRTEIARSVTP